ncbi:MAG: ABC transporter ATP-binding protein [Desulfobacteraceae bacterium]|nr:MAG: ABC transporter ATP-binding protein [Desulfobacteraceae bacterium]
MGENDKLLSVLGISVKYGAARVLEGISLFVQAGEIVTIIGANGAGKSTLLKSISGTISISGGDIIYLGKSIASCSPHRIVGMGISHIPERRELFPDLTVLENLEMGAYLQKDKGQFIRTRDWCFELFPILRERTSQLATTLSGGEQQMLSIARGLMSCPKLLLLDEPSLGLAPKIIRDIFNILISVNREGLTVLLVEENAHQALAVSKRSYVLENGKVVAEGKSADLINSAKVKEAYLGG